MIPGSSRFGFLEDFENFPVLWRPVEPLQPPRLLSAPERATAALMTACELLSRRGPDPRGWTTPFRRDPVAFLLDSVNDAVTLWGADGVRIYSNRAAKRTGLDVDYRQEITLQNFARAGRRFERRSVRLGYGGEDYLLEIFHEIH